MVSPLSTFGSDNIGDLFYSNTTENGTWTDPNNGTHYFYGGNFELRFKNTTCFAPWVNGSPPSMKIGCNGMSIKGGFLALLGLDDIKLQLQNAGALFAWGILVGLELTMPSLATVFQRIQKWARTIQRLLQNACNLGKKFANSSGLKGALAPINDKISSLGFGAIKDATGNIDNFFDKIDSFVDENVSKETQNKISEKYFSSGASLSMLAMYFGKYMPDDEKHSFIDTDLAKIYSKKVDGMKVSDNDEFARKILLSKLVFLLYGDLALNKNGIEGLTQLVKNGILDNAKTKETLKSVATGVRNYFSTGLVNIGPVIDTKDAGIALLKGFKEINDNPLCSDNKCNIPNYRVIYFNTRSSFPSKGALVDDKGGSKAVQVTQINNMRIKGMVLTKMDDGGDQIPLEWDGFFIESLKGIRAIVYNKVGGQSYSWYTDNYDVTRDKNIDLSKIKAPLMLPNIGKYLDIIATIERKKGSENAYTAHLKYLLAKANAHFAAMSLAISLPSLIEQMQDDPNSYMSIESTIVFQNYLKHIREVSKEIIRAVKQDMENENELNDIISLFEKIDKEIRSRLLKDKG